MADKRDVNERRLIDLWRGIGCTVIQMDRNAGFDLLVIRGINFIKRTFIVEVKNPALKWKLTESESRLKEKIGDEYNIIQTDEEALELIGYGSEFS